MDGTEGIADAGGIAVEVVLGGILEGCCLLRTLHTVGAGYAVADELDAAVGECCGPEDVALVVEDEAPELRMRVETFHGVCYPHAVAAVAESRGERYHRVGRTVEAHLEGLTAVDAHHEVAAHGAGNHLQ